ncbi:protein EARLY FLOWERING 3 [Cornus florida]|uniref:protein EARLY FLOWERING 3 n=1 Tax=Cornus florida TaxID=4283 RepID=UPI0028977680|nr:protein EARLY FLOWERING 3 [Cornus florida]XP_059644400.1 protein EARLY FLOWERING 3 [Cornus florida]
MKRGKDEEKSVGPMFPRLHVNDADKGGPRAPPRNKMALYEQLSVPSQSFNSGVLPLKPNNKTNLVPLASSSQGSGHERAMFFPPHLPFSTHPVERTHALYSDCNTPMVQLEQKKKLDQEDFTVPIFVHSGMGRHHGGSNNSMNMEGISPLDSACPGHLTKFPNAGDKEPKSTSIAGPNLRQESISQGKENSKEIMASGEQSIKSASILSVRKKTDGPSKQTNPFSNRECKDRSESICTTLKNADASFGEFRAGSQYVTARADCASDEPLRGIENREFSISRRDFCPVGQRSPDYPSNDSENREDMACGSLQTGNVDRGDDVSENSMVDCISNLDISPDDVVGVIGQKQFWKARRAIVNQQRMFAVQVFELHRLIKVQRIIAGSPHLLIEDNAYLGNTLKSFPSKKLPLDYIVKPLPHVVKDDSKKQNHKMECSAENAIERASLSSVQNGTQPSVYKPLPGNPPPKPATTDPKMGPWSFHQPSGNQWLIPVMSPSEGLIYKPYPGPAFMGPVCGGCGPPGSAPVTGDFFNQAYGVPASHHQYQGMGFSSVGHGYFPPYGMPVKNPTISDSAVEQMNHFTRPLSLGHCGQSSGGGANYNMQHESSCNVPSPRNGAFSNVMKLHASKEWDLRGSTASSPIERPEGIGAAGQTTVGRNVLPLFPTSPDVHLPEEASQRHDTDQSTRVIRVVPHNARSATDSVARIFQRIQEEKRA